MSFSTDIIQVGLSEDPINNFCLVSPIPPNGTMEVRQGHASAPGKLIATFNENGVSAPNISPVGGFKNKIINGNFAINQRAVSGTVTLAAGAYGHDRWKAGAGGCTYTFSSLVNTTAIAISAGSLQQVIEGSSLQSGTHTLSYTGTAPARINGGVWGVSGMTGTAVGGVNQTIEFGVGTVSLVQYEPGYYPTLHYPRPLQFEEMLCRRYLPVVPPSSEIMTFAASASLAIAEVVFGVTPRVKPTGMIAAPLVQFAATNFGGVAGVPTALGFSTASTYHGRIGVTTTAGSPTQTGGNAGYLLVGTGGYILFTGCEL